MKSDNFTRLIELADKIFAARQDPDQLNVNEDVIKRLQKIHPATMSDYLTENGPAAWVLIIPTTKSLMEQFLDQKINERELFEMTPLQEKYDAVYLCSALVLEEYRRKGITKDLVINAVQKIKKDHPIKCLFVWPFTEEGEKAAEKISGILNISLYKRK